MKDQEENDNPSLNNLGPQIDIEIPRPFIIPQPKSSDSVIVPITLDPVLGAAPVQVFHLTLVDMIATVKSQRLVCVKKNMYDAGIFYKYACVSYRWGECSEQIALTPDYNAHVTSFAIPDLITLCRQILNWRGDDWDDDDYIDDDFIRSVVKYLWVDAISVDQMDHVNKKKTINQMSGIYARAEVIVAVPDLHISYLLNSPTYAESISTISKYGKKIYSHITWQCRKKENHDEDDYDVADDQEKVNFWERKRGPDVTGLHKHRGFRQFIKDAVRQSGLAFWRGGHKEHGNNMTTEKSMKDLLAGNGEFIPAKSDDKRTGVQGNDDQTSSDNSNVDNKTSSTFKGNNSDTDDKNKKRDGCLCFVGMTEKEKESYDRAFKFLVYLVMDWANRVWVISEYSIGRRSKMKLCFLSACSSVNLDNQPTKLLDLFNERRPTIFDRPLKERSFLDMMMYSKATRNEDRFYAVLPLYKQFKHFADNHEISTWGINDQLSVRLQLLRIVQFQEKLAILLLCTQSSFVSDIILPSFASCNSGAEEHILDWATKLSYKPTLLKEIELLKDEDANCDYLRVVVPRSRTYYVDTIHAHDIELTENARGKLGLDLAELVTSFLPITVHSDERTNHTLGVKLLGNLEKNIWIMLNRMTDWTDVPASPSGNGSAGQHHESHELDTSDTLWSNEDEMVFHLY
ncbi:uncharacterized protein BX664DRAFT_369197 [Halteromyces radiatus]|uniref:uncharacterized protein n=1 Tax=Halteromyces radiatus TaxID=101107 RepID=UPI00221F502D|nr:uncharacterized protein BX664DRAFT_369197 [Halteromyces radiatus]KAI8078786.1 hypothetical protein BX664DRAFT_369197 [Halteromyces radiatus]